MDSKYNLDENDTDLRQFYEEKYKISMEEWDQIFPKAERRKEKLDYHYCIGWLEHMHILKKGRLAARLRNQIGELNKYIHLGFMHTDFGRRHRVGCVAVVKYEEEQFSKVIAFFQDVVLLLIKTLVDSIRELLPNKVEKMDECLQGLITLKNVEKDLERETIFSTDLNTYISILKKRGK